MMRAGFVLLVLGSMCIVGCGGEPSGAVKGSVLHMGQRVAGAQIVFVRESGDVKQFAGVSGVTGEYYFTYPNVQKLPVGRYQVTVSVTTIPAGVPLPPSEETEGLKAQGKAKEASYLFDKDVVAGPNQIDFELTQGQKISAPRESSS